MRSLSSEVRLWPPQQLAEPGAWLLLAPDLTGPGPVKRPRRAPPATPGKMAPAEQLRHQPWRRARPSAILASSNCHHPPPPQDPIFRATWGAQTASGPRTLGQNNAVRVSLLFGPAARAPQEGPAWAAGPPRAVRVLPGPAAGPRRCFWVRERCCGERAVPPADSRGEPSRALGWGGRSAPSSARRGCPQKPREGGNQDEK